MIGIFSDNNFFTKRSIKSFKLSLKITPVSQTLGFTNFDSLSDASWLNFSFSYEISGKISRMNSLIEV